MATDLLVTLAAIAFVTGAVGFGVTAWVNRRRAPACPARLASLPLDEVIGHALHAAPIPRFDAALAAAMEAYRVHVATCPLCAEVEARIDETAPWAWRRTMARCDEGAQLVTTLVEAGC